VVVALSGYIQGCAPLTVGLVDEGAGLHEQLDDMRVAIGRGDVQRKRAV